ncbi:MAG: hypothetical protein AB7N73_14545 [Gemmatimonadales bacterium]
MPFPLVPVIAGGAALMGAKAQSNAQGAQQAATRQQQRLLDEILNESRRRRDEQAPIRSAAQSRFLELLNQGTPGFDPGQFTDRLNPFRGNFGGGTPVAAREALPMPSAPAAPAATSGGSPFEGNAAVDALRRLMGGGAPAPASAAVDPSKMRLAHDVLGSLDSSKMPDKFKARFADQIRAKAAALGYLPR